MGEGKNPEPLEFGFLRFSHFQMIANNMTFFNENVILFARGLGSFPALNENDISG